MYRLDDDLALTFEQSEKLAAALAAVFESISDEELSARYRAIEAGFAAWYISCLYLGGGLLFEWAGYPLLVIDSILSCSGGAQQHPPRRANRHHDQLVNGGEISHVLIGSYHYVSRDQVTSFIEAHSHAGYTAS
jgi:hypothetical protein